MSSVSSALPAGSHFIITPQGGDCPHCTDAETEVCPAGEVACLWPESGLRVTSGQTHFRVPLFVMGEEIASEVAGVLAQDWLSPDPMGSQADLFASQCLSSLYDRRWILVPGKCHLAWEDTLPTPRVWKVPQEKKCFPDMLPGVWQGACGTCVMGLFFLSFVSQLQFHCIS